MLRPLAIREAARPLGQGESHLARRLRNAGIPTLALCAGFTFSAVLLFTVASFVGAAVGVTLLPENVRLTTAVVCCAAMVVLDSVALRRHAMCPVGFRRQTPKSMVLQYGDTKGALIWGLDTGLAITTFRVSAATWAMIALGLLHVAPWWQGLAYAVGFCLPVAVAILLVPRLPDHPDGTSPEPEWISRLLFRHRRVAQALALGSALAAGLAIGAAVVS